MKLFISLIWTWTLTRTRFAEGVQEGPGAGSEGAGLIWARPGGNAWASEGEESRSDSEPGETDRNQNQEIKRCESECGVVVCRRNTGGIWRRRSWGKGWSWAPTSWRSIEPPGPRRSRARYRITRSWWDYRGLCKTWHQLIKIKWTKVLNIKVKIWTIFMATSFKCS